VAPSAVRRRRSRLRPRIVRRTRMGGSAGFARCWTAATAAAVSSARFSGLDQISLMRCSASAAASAAACSWPLSFSGTSIELPANRPGGTRSALWLGLALLTCPDRRAWRTLKDASGVEVRLAVPDQNDVPPPRRTRHGRHGCRCPPVTSLAKISPTTPHAPACGRNWRPSADASKAACPLPATAVVAVLGVESPPKVDVIALTAACVRTGAAPASHRFFPRNVSAVRAVRAVFSALPHGPCTRVVQTRCARCLPAVRCERRCLVEAPH